MLALTDITDFNMQNSIAEVEIQFRSGLAYRLDTVEQDWRERHKDGMAGPRHGEQD
jgi:hypothetical protein